MPHNRQQTLSKIVVTCLFVHVIYIHMTTGCLNLRIINCKRHGTEMSWPNINYKRERGKTKLSAEPLSRDLNPGSP